MGKMYSVVTPRFGRRGLNSKRAAMHSKKARIKYETKKITFDQKTESNMSLPFPDQSDPKSRIKKLDPKWDQIFPSNDTEMDQNNDP